MFHFVVDSHDCHVALKSLKVMSEDGTQNENDRMTLVLL